MIILIVLGLNAKSCFIARKMLDFAPRTTLSGIEPAEERANNVGHQNEEDGERP
jgi:hypothetical protein